MASAWRTSLRNDAGAGHWGEYGDLRHGPRGAAEAIAVPGAGTTGADYRRGDGCAGFQAIRVAKWFMGAAAFTVFGDNVSLARREGPEPLKGARVSANFLAVLGAAPAEGRSFLASEEQLGPKVALISDGLFRRRLGGDDSVAAIGRVGRRRRCRPCSPCGAWRRWWRPQKVSAEASCSAWNCSPARAGCGNLRCDGLLGVAPRAGVEHSPRAGRAERGTLCGWWWVKGCACP